MLDTISTEINVRQFHLPKQSNGKNETGGHLAATEQAVIHQLWHRGYRHLHAVKCRCLRTDSSHTLAILSGRVPSFYLKQIAQEAARYVTGVDRVDNRIEVSDAKIVRSTNDQ